MAEPLKRLIWSREAVNSLEALIEHLREHSITSKLIQQAEMLRLFPELGAREGRSNLCFSLAH